MSPLSSPSVKLSLSINSDFTTDFRIKQLELFMQECVLFCKKENEMCRHLLLKCEHLERAEENKHTFFSFTFKKGYKTSQIIYSGRGIFLLWMSSVSSQRHVSQILNYLCPASWTLDPFICNFRSHYARSLLMTGLTNRASCNPNLANRPSLLWHNQ